ncbi:hypothetical protein LshimejAT787_1302520 [Lyophyllum shimeji]|uniref:F-box domain-containing protein n=1 Tax=Lyophyllum shimeji TaxID=47721 RepID=A0A9P3PY94_LYOSH|nr:hypothetical protein LshimejAT787_1302520 [Lyophyllum shimeji]
MVSRTSSLLRARSRPIPNKLLRSSTFDARFPSPRVPHELIDHILGFALLPALDTPKSLEFSSVVPFTLVSAGFRQIALRRFFRDIALTCTTQWTMLFNLLEAEANRTPGRTSSGSFAWVKSLTASSNVLSYKPIRLSYLSYLRVLSIDLAREGLSTQHPLLSSLFSYLEPTNACPNLTSLKLSNLPRVDVLLLRLIAKQFPRLTDLYLSCTERIAFECCWACFEDSLSCTTHSPIPDNYSDAATMAEAFASALKPLTPLKHLHLGIFLSDERLLYSHIAHSIGDGEHLGMVANSFICKACFDKAVHTVRPLEVAASIIFGQQLKALKTIGWSSFFSSDPGHTRLHQHINSDDTVDEQIAPAGKSQDEVSCSDEDPNDDDDDADDGVAQAPEFAPDIDLKTTFRIMRSDGRIRVRRASWRDVEDL